MKPAEVFSSQGGFFVGGLFVEALPAYSCKRRRQLLKIFKLFIRFCCSVYANDTFPDSDVLFRNMFSSYLQSKQIFIPLNTVIYRERTRSSTEVNRVNGDRAMFSSAVLKKQN
ncbi:unnamed protein product [Caretta caretta]